MRKGKDIVGKPLVAYDSGEKVETVVDLIFDQYDNRLLGFLIDEGGWFSNAKVLPLNLVKAIGVDAIIIQSKEAIALATDYPDIHKILESNNILNGTRIMTTDGRDLGTLIDFYFDEQTGIVEGYEASGGLFADAYSGRSFVPAPQTLKIGEDVAFVPAETAGLMEEQVGGFKAVMQNAGDKLQETAQIASEKIQETAQIAGDKFQETGRAVSSKVTDTIVDPAAQKAFVIDKVAQETVAAPDGGQIVAAGAIITAGMCDAAEHLGILDELYRSAGGTLTKPLGERMETVVASLTIEQAEGRRAQRAIYTSEGYMVVAQGQIVTTKVIDRARVNHQEAALLDVVGLSTSEAAQSQANTLVTNTGQQLKTTGAIASEQIQEGASQLWDKVKEAASDLQGKSTQAIEEQRIKGALGRPTTRVILALNDEVILNMGELITHKAIDSARSAGILDLLLDSVYTETPQLAIKEMQAPTAGKSAL
jgi:uncharacterized protein YrrD